MRRIPFHRFAVAVAVLAAGAVIGGLAASTAIADTATTPRPCTAAGMQLPAGTAVKVDAAGNAWTIDAQVPYVREQVCTDGRWVPVTGYGTTAAKPRPALPGWFHARRIGDGCGRGDAGVMAWPSHGDQSVVICRNGDIEPS